MSTPTTSNDPARGSIPTPAPRKIRPANLFRTTIKIPLEMANDLNRYKAQGLSMSAICRKALADFLKRAKTMTMDEVLRLGEDEPVDSGEPGDPGESENE